MPLTNSALILGDSSVLGWGRFFWLEKVTAKTEQLKEHLKVLLFF